MSYPRWPDTLPTPRREGYSHGGELPVIRTAMESGRDRTYRYSDVTMRTVGCSVIVNDAQAAQFWEFFDGPANAGADWFYMPIDTANCVAEHLVRITGYPGAVPVSGEQYQITLRLETDQQHIDWSATQ